MHAGRGLISDSGTGYVVHATDGALSEDVVCSGEGVGGKFAVPSDWQGKVCGGRDSAAVLEGA